MPPTPQQESSPSKAGVTFTRHFAIADRLPALKAGYGNITKYCGNRFGPPPRGTRVFIRIRQVMNGWEEVPMQTNAIVPSCNVTRYFVDGVTV